MKVLLTGFTAFDGEKINPAFLALQGLPSEINDIEIIKLEIPTVFNKSLELLEGALSEHKPDIVIALGQAGGRFAITPEVVAINLNEARIADNEGNQPSDEKIKIDGENAYFSSLPNKAIVKALTDAEIPAKLSYTAGTFVCNHLFYGLMYNLAHHYPTCRGGFIHLPYIREQVVDKLNQPYMELSVMTKALTIIVQTVVDNKHDIKFVAGAEC